MLRFRLPFNAALINKKLLFNLYFCLNILHGRSSLRRFWYTLSLLKNTQIIYIVSVVPVYLLVYSFSDSSWKVSILFCPPGDQYSMHRLYPLKAFVDELRYASSCSHHRAQLPATHWTRVAPFLPLQWWMSTILYLDTISNYFIQIHLQKVGQSIW